MAKKKLPHIAVTEDALSPPSDAGDGQWGSVIEFAGVVRKMEDGQPISGIRYSAYRPMAENVLRQVVAEAADRFSRHALWVEHRIGFVPAGEPSLIFRVSTPHSREGFEISAFCLNAIKTRVPIWKEPVFHSEKLESKK